MKPEEANDLCAFAKKYHITIVPQVNYLGERLGREISADERDLAFAAYQAS